MAITDTKIVDWRILRDSNSPKSQEKILGDLAGQLRNIKSVARKQSEDRAFEAHDPNYTVSHASILTVTILSLLGNWTAYVQRHRKIRAFNSLSDEAIYGHVIATGVYDTAANTTSATIAFYTTYSTYYDRLAFGVDTRFPSPMPYSGCAGSHTHTGTSTTFDIVFPTYAASDTVDEFDPPAVQELTTKRGIAETYCDYFVKLQATTVSEDIAANACVVKKIYARQEHQFSVELISAPGAGNSVTFDWAIFHPQRQLLTVAGYTDSSGNPVSYVEES